MRIPFSRKARAVLLLALAFFIIFACGSEPTRVDGTAVGGGANDAAAGAPPNGAVGVGGRTSSAGASQGGASQGGASASNTAGTNAAGQAESAGGSSRAGSGGRASAGMDAAGAAGSPSSAAGAGSAGGVGGVASGGGSAGALPTVTVWIAGDSTVANGGPCPIGWGAQFKALFNAKVSVTNSAVAGRSVRTWMYDVQDSKDSAGECNLAKDAQGNPTLQARYSALLNGMKSGDYLLVQFGINDGDSACPRHVGASAFKTSYGVLAQAAKDRGAQAVFITPVSQIACSGSTVTKNTREPYVTATKESGTQFGVPVIDLNSLSTALYQSLGFCPIPGGSDVSASTTGAVGAFFCDDHTHFDTTGAQQIAKLVAQGVREQKLGLAAYLQ
ncbi:MAG TPA: SGNH/GDSL hydrolase family protein [Polyangiaceae bacterium]|nr:SGNH/GDSL hydrolase family protein [Polyangiaceae bacterium]